MTDVTFNDSMEVRLMQSMGSDASIVAAARVSTQGAESRESFDSSEGAGLINFLMKNRHGCYDSHTEVLTKDGWKFWPEIDGSEEFLTLDMRTDEMVYQKAERLVRKPSEGPMIHISMAHVDALVTPDHRMVAAPRTSDGFEYGLHSAKEFMKRSHRVRLGGGEWVGDIHAPELAALVGFVAADGNVGTSIEFNLCKDRKIEWLRNTVSQVGFGSAALSETSGRYRIVNPSEQLKLWCKDTYTHDGERCFPRELLERGDRDTIQAMLDGYLEGDGHVSQTGKIQCSTISKRLVGDIQESALKAGLAAVETSPDLERSQAYGSKPLYRVTIYRERNMEPKIGWTQESRDNQVQLVEYDGDVHCVTVPNGTLYVRRNGKPMWCGNTPFEHNAMTFFVKAPIFVYREWHRHRVGWSYNEESGRYKQLEPEFYIPGRERKLKQEGKPGHYIFVPGSDADHEVMSKGHKATCLVSYANYEKQLEAGVAKEVARMTLPVNIYSSMYATMNTRSLMSFLSLRTKHEDSKFPSYPQREIEMCAEMMEAEFARLFPLTYKSFVDNGRVAP